MNNDLEAKKALNTDEMEKVSGGSFEEWWAYEDIMKEKYGEDYTKYMTREERDMLKKWLLHQPGEPDPV